MKKPTIPGQLYITAAAVLWSTSGLFITFLDCHPVIIAGLRSLIAAAFLLAVRSFLQRKSMADWRRVLRNRWVWGGGAAYAAAMITFVIANKLTAPANAILLQYSAPVWAALFAWALLKERLRLQHWAALALSACGLFLFFRDSLQTSAGAMAGNMVAVLSGMVFGASSVFMRANKQSPYGSPADSMTLSHVLTALCMIPFLVIAPPSLNQFGVLALLFMGVCQVGLASMLFSYGIIKVPAVSAMLLSSIEPVLNPLWVLLVTGAKPSTGALAGGAVIICAALTASLRFSRAPSARK